MKRGIFNLLLLCSCFSRAWAQPVLNSCGNVFHEGDGYSGIRHQVDTTSFFPVQLGQGVTWNYANLTSTTVNVTQSYLSVGNSPNPGPYAGANIVQRSGPSNYYYLSHLPGAVTYYGVYTPFTATIYADPLVKYTCPLHFGASFTDTYSATSSTAAPFSGRIKGTYAGYGTLILPHTTFYDAILIHTFDTVVVGTSSTYYEDFQWYDGQLNIVRLSAMRVRSASSPNASSAIQYTEITSITLGQAPAAWAAQVQVHPNPASTAIEVDVPSQLGLGVFRLHDLQGRLLLQRPVDSEQGRVALPDLAQGLYRYDIYDQHGLLIKSGKLVKE